MRNKVLNIFLGIVGLMLLGACSNSTIDDDGLLITGRDDCYVSNFDLTGTDHITVKVGDAIIDNEACTIDITVLYGTDLHNLYPKFSLVTDAILEPKITGLTDFSDLANPKQYTVVSGSRKVRKTYTIYIHVQERNSNS